MTGPFLVDAGPAGSGKTAAKKPHHVLWMQSIGRLRQAVDELHSLALEEVEKDVGISLPDREAEPTPSLQNFLELDGVPVNNLADEISTLVATLREKLF